MNFLALIGAALIPMIIGFVYYNPALVGKAWQKEAGVSDDQIKEGNMLVILGVSLLLSFFLAFLLRGFVIHQAALFSLFVTQPGFNEAGSEIHTFFTQFMEKYGDLHRSFGHGAIHGFIFTIAGVFPLVGINALFERRSWKYIGIHVGYWTIVCVLMGGVLCQFG